VPLLELRGLSAGYGPVKVLRNLNLNVAEGELVTVVGPNGAGKTTLLRAVMRLIESQGETLFRGENISGLPTAVLARRGIILVQEGRGLFGQMSVRENLALGAYLIRTDRAEIARRQDRVFTLFPRLRERLGQTAASMSGGEQQMLALGRALMAGPRLLLLDEPSLGLAPRVAEEILATLGELNRDGLGILLVEQKAPLALKLARRAYVVAVGSIVAELATEHITSHHDLTQFYFG
jgi:branched-chain amino acid transport system ATP-binding protein